MAAPNAAAAKPPLMTFLALTPLEGTDWAAPVLLEPLVEVAVPVVEDFEAEDLVELALEALALLLIAEDAEELAEEALEALDALAEEVMLTLPED